MNIEMSYLHMIRNRLRIRYYGGKAMSVVLAALRRPADTAGYSIRKDTQSANLERERYSAVTMAQVQSCRFNR